jgi:hypothetical protein
MILQLTKLRLRNSADNQKVRCSDFLGKSFLPAAQRAGIGPVGFFSSMVAPDTPYLLVLTSYASLAAMETAAAKLVADREYTKALEAFDGQPGLNYVRMERSLLRAFDAMPAVQVPPGDANRPGRVFELRTYESNNSTSLKKKIKMFADGEIAIFRKSGLLPVFFGETIVGTNMPNLTYMLAYDDLATREKNWKVFGSSPEWQKLRATPGYADAEIVSNISNVFLSPLPFSPIR